MGISQSDFEIAEKCAHFSVDWYVLVKYPVRNIENEWVGLCSEKIGSRGESTASQPSLKNKSPFANA